MGTHRSRLRLSWTIAVLSLLWMMPHSTEQDDVFCGLPEVVEAVSTRLMRRFNGSRLVVGVEEVCTTFPMGKYRTADGTCNHLFNLGAANRPPRRFMSNAYDDGLNAPRTRASSGAELPSPTLVSRVIQPPRVRFQRFTIMLMQWGQFIYHDMTGFPITSEVDESIQCCGNNGELLPSHPNRECFPIRLTGLDINTRFRGRCMEFARSVAARDKYGEKLVPREQINSVTSFIDGSMIYGSSQELQNELRAQFRGKPLAQLNMTQSLDLLPENPDAECTHGPQEFCFKAGNTRVNEHPGLMAIHTVFVRIHNDIVDGLRMVRPKDSQEELFQIARKILVAIVQNVHYGEWLPLIMGREAASRYRLLPGFRTEYIPSLDPRIANAFATAAFRFGHSLIPDAFVIGNRRRLLRDLFGLVSPLFENFTDVLLALVSPSDEFGGDGGARALGRFFTEEVTGHLFETEAIMDGLPSDGLDLVALNIQRGRDHGLPPYNEFRKFCGLEPLRNFSFFPFPLSRQYQRVYNSVDDIDMFSGIMFVVCSSVDDIDLFSGIMFVVCSSVDDIDLFSGIMFVVCSSVDDIDLFSGIMFVVCSSVDDIDLFSGIMSEPPTSGIVGETLACLLGNQFHALKFGDRFFYETSRPTEGFTDDQLNNIRNITMAHVCCQVKGVPWVPRSPFLNLNNISNPVVLCYELHGYLIDFSLWENFPEL